jgi:ATP-dependent helicase/nuclease subunit A
MTVHGSKGLQAPIVILADATGNPDSSPTRGLTLEELLPGGGGRTLPLPDLRGEEKVGRIAEADERVRREEREEHWRLLYVAMTRAEEALFIGGALGKREQEPAADSWYARLAPLFTCDPVADEIWGERREWGTHAPMLLAAARTEPCVARALPDWAARPIGPEPRPPRPLAPSAAGEEYGADPPLPSGALAAAARRGVLIHRLLERLPEVALDARVEQAREWLARNAPDVPAEGQAEVLACVFTVLDSPVWAELFSPAALAEVPLAATVGGQVIAGTADRLLVERDRVLVADFKTARRPPASLAEVPPATLRQLGAYTAALAAIYPGRRIEAAVLYTQTPLLIVLPPELLEAHKPGLMAGQESLGR